MHYTRELPTCDSYDVIICGGGPAGFAAGISAARLGARTLLLEASSALGGMATQGLVTSYDGMADGSRPLVGGIMQEIMERLHDEGLLPSVSSPRSWRENYLHPTKIKPEECKWFFDRMAQESGLEVRYLSRAVDAVLDSSERRIEHLIVSDLEGLRAIPARAVIDATGDATVAARAGAPFQLALRDTEHVMPATLCFILANVDEKCMKSPASFAEQALADGHFRNPEVRFIPSKIGPGVYSYNAGHVFAFDATDPAQHSKALMEGRDIVAEHFAFLRKYVPGYENSVLAATAPLLGVRESRRIIGECILTQEDYVSGRHFHDQIGIYNKEPDQHLYEPTAEAMAEHSAAREARIGWLPPGASYGLPYGILVPGGGWKNLWVAGRSASTDVFVHSSSRVMPACAMMGEAAGCAAVQHLHTGQPACDLETHTLITALRAQGAILPQKTLRPEMTRGDGRKRGAIPIVRMSLDEPHVPAMEAVLKRKKPASRPSTPANPDALRSQLCRTCDQMTAECCRSRFVNADEVLEAIAAEAGRCADAQLLDLANRLQGCIDQLCCKSSFFDDGRLAAAAQPAESAAKT